MYFIGTRSDRIDIWDHQTKQHLATLRSVGGFDAYTYCFSGNGHLLAVASRDRREVIVWDIANIDDCQEICRLLNPSSGIHCFVFAVCFMDNGEHLIVGYDGGVVLFDVHSGSPMHTTSSICGAVFVHCFNSEILAPSHNGILQKWDSALAETRRQLVGFETYRACVSKSGGSVVAAVNDLIMIVDLDTWESKETFVGVSDFDGLQFSADDSKILASTWNSSRTLVLDVVNEAVLLEFDTDGGACFSPDAKCVFGSSSMNGIVCLDVETSAVIPCSFTAPEMTRMQCYDRLLVLSAVPDVILL
jgi:WD40 repeat protein